MNSFTLKPLSQQTVVVFGASSGIGRVTALEMGKKGAKVVLAARRKAELEAVAALITAEGGQALVTPADTAEFDQVKNVADQAVRQFGGIDTWAHVAGAGLYGRFWDLPPEDFARSVQINLMGQVYGAMAALPPLRQRGSGALIHVSSVESEIGAPYQSAYAAAKHGMKGFIDVLRMEVEHEGLPVSVTNIKPSSIDTPFFKSARTYLGVEPKAIPPVYPPERVARAILEAAETPAGDVIVGEAGHAAVWSKRLMPGIADAVVKNTAFDSQLTQTPKSATAVNDGLNRLAG